ncbi:MAG: tRNA pseudouridine(13) synthase TruD, partial [Candidatus Methanospirareceae archaeon]
MSLKESPESEKRIGIWYYSTKTEGIGGFIKTRPSDFVVREVTAREERDEREKRDERVEREKREKREEGKYLILELTKENWDTYGVVREISRRLRVSKNRIG